MASAGRPVGAGRRVRRICLSILDQKTGVCGAIYWHSDLVELLGPQRGLQVVYVQSVVSSYLDVKQNTTCLSWE